MKTGFNDLDNIMEMNRGDLVIVASRPGMGKSTLALTILNNVAIKEKKPVLLFSLENSKEKIINKLIISNSMVEADKFEIYDKYQKGKILKPEFTDEDWDRISYGINILKDAPIFISTTAPYIIDDICKESREFKVKQNIELIIIDYLQLIQFDKSKTLSRDNENREILKMLKTLAKELDIPIIITSQLSRKPEERDDKRPCITDFTNSASSILTYSDKIELGCHTKMSEIYGIESVENYIDEAIKRGCTSLGITDINSVQSFIPAQKYIEKINKKDFKILYGLRTKFIEDEYAKEKCEKDAYDIVIYVKEQKGLKKLYNILSLANTNTENNEIIIYKSQLDKYRDGLLYGTVGNKGELYQSILFNKNDTGKIAKYYDFIEVEPIYEYKSEYERKEKININKK